MGQSNSISQSSYEDTENQINQISHQTCTTTCLADINSSVTITNSKNINISLKDGCFITGSSCTLKSTLNNSLTNTQTDKEKSSIKSGSDPLPVINFGSNNVNEQNYQKIANEVTQDINSLCQLNSESNINKPIVLDGDMNVKWSTSTESNITNQQCIVENAASSKVKNSQSNTMSASIVGVDCLSAIMNSVGVIVVMGGLVSMASITGASYVEGQRIKGRTIGEEGELEAQSEGLIKTGSPPSSPTGSSSSPTGSPTKSSSK